MNLKNLSDEALLSDTKISAMREREMTLKVLHHLKEVDRRRLFATLGYDSLFQYATQELGYCNPSASRRIDAMRLLKELPELEAKIQEGELCLSTVARAQVFFKKEEMTSAQKKDLMIQLEGMSTREVERKLLQVSNEPEVHFNERTRPVTETHSEVKFYADEALLKDLEKIRTFLSHSHPGMSMAQLVRYLATLGLKKLDPALQVNRKKPVSKTAESTQENLNSNSVLPPKSVPAPDRQSRYIPQSLRREVWRRDQGKCAWVHSQSGRRCNSPFRLQVDHIHPFALGGLNELSNLRLLCFHHNQLEAKRLFPWVSQSFYKSRNT